ncbi:MAG: hypothetical protein A07HR60_01183 [uncultured archaeon A07HR60]|nr:MAG: hypothetical protein A07HR60_01183 [uncultured archaeon A07HR60]
MYSHDHDIVDQTVVRNYHTVIDDDTRITYDAMVQSGSKVGHNSVVGARAIVQGDVPAHHVVVGKPAKSVKSNLAGSRQLPRLLTANSRIIKKTAVLSMISVTISTDSTSLTGTSLLPMQSESCSWLIPVSDWTQRRRSLGLLSATLSLRPPGSLSTPASFTAAPSLVRLGEEAFRCRGAVPVSPTHPRGPCSRDATHNCDPTHRRGKLHATCRRC